MGRGEGSRPRAEKPEGSQGEDLPLPVDVLRSVLRFVPARELARVQPVCGPWYLVACAELWNIRAALGALREAVAPRVLALYDAVTAIESGLLPASMRRLVDAQAHLRADYGLRYLSVWMEAASAHGMSTSDSALAFHALVLGCVERATAPRDRDSSPPRSSSNTGWARLFPTP
eukprot:TRINITY_DN70907_c0_g1_i1.p1 TRINITY_DN70907_c0_g1~~TRINITY_DN70907_c0_g1_i1.p1  ORF type:complete len:203 (+),score=54.64 TRINITY_DN70907_c0_g1_i1:89-610(+)